jgi:hypothetical protein
MYPVHERTHCHHPLPCTTNNFLITVCCLLGFLTDIFSSTFTSGQQGLGQDASTASALVAAYAHTGEHTAALQVWYDLRGDGGCVSLSAHRALLAACAAAAAWGPALQVLAAMQASSVTALRQFLLNRTWAAQPPVFSSVQEGLSQQETWKCNYHLRCRAQTDTLCCSLCFTGSLEVVSCKVLSAC